MFLVWHLPKLDWRFGLSLPSAGPNMRRLFYWIAGVLVFLLIVILASAYFLDEPLRKKIEADLNHP
jgi:hypothetical protein